MSDSRLEEMARAERARQAGFRVRLFCCSLTACLASGAQAVIDALREEIAMRQLDTDVELVPTGCMGLCSAGPLVRVDSGEASTLYGNVNPLLARLIVADHVAHGLQPSSAAAPALPRFLQEHTIDLASPFFAKQRRVVLANSSHMDPASLEQCVARGGYEGLRTALAMPPEEVIEVVARSGLRGRGGGGYPTATKWRFVRGASGREKFIICNGDEGDPGAYMDRSILEGDPHAVIEGMLIAAYATGADKGWFYIRAEYPLALERIEAALRQARRVGLLGKGILGHDFDFECEVRLGAGAFVCGEETALIASLEGKRGTPRPRPPYPSVRGLWDQPSCVNNVETFANVPAILRDGPERFAQVGTAASKGTKVFALTGKAKHIGLVEVPMGTTLREIVEVIGGGTATGRKLKAVQTGGPSGGVIPERLLDVEVCYETLKDLGSMMGSGGMIVMDEGDSMLDVAAFYLGFTVEESCGKCAPCREGSTQLLLLLKKVQSGEASFDDIDKIEALAHAMSKASLCGLGQTAANPVVAGLRYFEDDFTNNLRVYASRMKGSVS